MFGENTMVSGIEIVPSTNAVSRIKPNAMEI